MIVNTTNCARYHLLVIVILLSVAVLSACGSGDKSSASSITISGDASGFAAPTAIAVVAGDARVTLTWKNVSSATSYNLYMATQSGVSKTAYSLKYVSVTSPQLVPNLQNNTTYFFVLTAVNSAAETSESAEIYSTPTAGTPGSIVIRGKIQYEDKQYGPHGFTGITSYKPVRNADFEIVNTPCSGSTGTDGTYSCTVSASTSSVVYVRVMSAASFDSSLLEVRDRYGMLHSVPSGTFIPSGDAHVNISIPAVHPAGGAYNILDVYTAGFEFIHSLSGSKYPPSLNAYWDVGHLYGTWYCYAPMGGCPQGVGIYILGGNFDGSGDTDHYDDDVLWHEFGHFVATNFSRDDSPGGPHYLSQNDQDLRLAWSEGWGNFFPATAKKWIWNSVDPSIKNVFSALPPPDMFFSGYVDTVDSSVGISFDFGSVIGAPYIFASNEISVARILWDIENTHSIQRIWNVISGYTPTNPALPEQVNLETFWDGWHALPSPPVISPIFNSRSVVYAQDSFEPNDDIASASVYTVNVSGSLEHRFYGRGDADYVIFSALPASSYTISTSNLLNGADTYIEIYDALGARLAFNDNASGAVYTNSVPNNCDYYGFCHENTVSLLASQVTFTPPSPGQYYAKITSSLNKPLSAGNYGTYRISIASQ
jgi:hypothetical protein